MSCPVKMYQTRQIIRHDQTLPLPNCMYKMKNIHDVKNGESEVQRLTPSDHVSTPIKQISNISHQDLDLQHESEMNSLIDRQEKILKQLDQLHDQILNLKTNIASCGGSTDKTSACIVNANTKSVPIQIKNGKTVVINASPLHPPYSLLQVKKAWSGSATLHVTTYLHSSVSELNQAAKELSKELECCSVETNLPLVNVKLIWKNVGPETELIVSQLPIIGEANILRYLSRLTPNHLRYENLKNSHEIDAVLDLSYCLSRSSTKSEKTAITQSLLKRLGKSDWLCDSSCRTIADIAASSAIMQSSSTNDTNPRINKWLKLCKA